MRYKGNFIFVVLLATSLTTTAAYSQSPTSIQNPTLSPTTAPTNRTTPTTQAQPNDVSERLRRLEQDRERLRRLEQNREQEIDVMKKLREYDLNDPALWTAIGWMCLGGTIGGFVFELLSLQGNIELPHGPTEDELAAKFAYANPDHVYDLGVISRCIIGALAAPPAMLFFRPEGYFALLAMSVIAGSAGTALFRSLQDRLLLAIAQKDTLETEKKVKKENANAKLDEAFKTFEQLEREIRKVSVRPQKEQEESVLFFAAETELNFKDFDKLKEILSQSKGVNAKVDSAIQTLDQLGEELRKVTTREKDASTLIFHHQANIPLKYFDNIRKCLSEAKGINENIVTADDIKPSTPRARAKESSNGKANEPNANDPVKSHP